MLRAVSSSKSLLSLLLATTVVGCAGELADVDDESHAAEAADSEQLGQVTQALASDVSVYTNTALASPWQNWGWSSTVTFNNTQAPLLSGSTNQIKATMTSAWGAISLARSSGNLTPISDYESISFDVRASAASTLYMELETLAGAAGTQVTIPVSTSWSKKTITIASLKGSLTAFGKITLMGPTANQSFYIDNVLIKAKAAPPPPPPPPPPPTTFPTNPITVAYNNVVTLNSPSGPYYLYVPSAYPSNHNTATKVLVWMHGCGGDGFGDAWSVSPGGAQSYLTVSVGGRSGQCWNVDADTTMVLAALDDVKKRVNVDPKRVVIGGYSSGGDMAYRVAFYNASRFAGVIAENTSPFRDTGSTQAASIAAASWKFNVAHLAHLSDDTYPIAGVRTETNALTTAGFPMTRIERAGTHWDPDTSSSGTDYDLRTYLLPYLNAGWVAP